MSRPDEPQPAAAPVETAMGTQSEAGAPGEHLPPLPLTADEQTLADRLRAEVSTDRSDDADPAVEDSPAMVEAVEDDSVVPMEPADPAGNSDAAADPLTPQFREPSGG
jgi:hypothetical protein